MNVPPFAKSWPPRGPGSRRGQILRDLAPKGLPLLAVIGIVFLSFLYAICTQYIEPDQFAVKQVDVPVPFFTGVAGIYLNIFVTGIQLRGPRCEKIFIFSQKGRPGTLPP